jgi:hypothetical protein
MISEVRQTGQVELLLALMDRGLYYGLSSLQRV